ncbi:MAG: molybdopterin-dependent oxidoreductase [Deltaproteobacteria bacterium]|nr:molybdopterin-dependent oxidoreductase [Deltaproteobacteria bacterium]
MGVGPGIDRRSFFKLVSAAGMGALASTARDAWGVVRVENPLRDYPSHDWERSYRDLYRHDGSFVFTCAPNDTHNCHLRALTKNGVVVRIMPTYKYGEARDLQGNQASHRWDPRCCQKGLSLTRRFYGDRRVRYPMVRRGFKQWVEQGFPRDANGKPPENLFRRGQDTFERVTWDQAADYVARTLKNVAETYTGPQGTARLTAQGYDPDTVTAVNGVGTQVLKFRGGMPLLGVTRVLAQYRLANAMALLDAKVRNVGPDQAKGARGWDNYSWHTDLPPGHTMVTGSQTIEWDLYSVENARMVIVWGMNWITTKMPDAHWLTEARLKGTRVVVIACEYSATCNKADQAIVVRPGVTPALALGLAHVILRERLWDDDFVKRFTDLPLLVRMDTMQLLKAGDVFPGYRNAALSNNTHVMPAGTQPPPPHMQDGQYIPQALRDEWGDFVCWSASRRAAVAVTRDQVGQRFNPQAVNPQLEGEVTVRLANGQTVAARSVFDLLKQYVMDNFTPQATEEITWAPAAAVESLAREIAQHRGQTLFAVGMGPNQFFNNDLKDRAIFLLASLTANIGQPGGNVGSYAGNYRVALFNGIPTYINEDPFNLQLDPAQPPRVKQYWVAESAHYYNHGDKPLRYGRRNLTGRSHMPTPTKTLWFSNANSILGNVKWHYEVVNNVLPKMEMICVNEWWWSTSCEYADVVMAIDSWAELKHPDMTASCTNSFLHMLPATELRRVHDTLGDIEVAQRVTRRLAELIDDPRMAEVFRFVGENNVAAYLQRILDTSTSTRGYRVPDLLATAAQGTPAIMMNRTTPRVGAWEQVHESVPFWTRSGRLEFYRDEAEFRSAGENLPVHREPIDSTFYEPNAILAAPHPAIRPEGPEAFGADPNDVSAEARQARNVVRTWAELRATEHPLHHHDAAYKFIFHTPKYRHGVHTTPIDLDQIAVWFGPFGDIYRHDRRTPWVTEGYVDINPADARELGVNDGDYVWIDADPEDRPFHGWQQRPEAYKVARMMARARFYPGTPRGVTRMFFHMYGATHGSVRAHETRPDGLARSEGTNYQAMFRYGSHQSATRGWLKPTLMTDSLVRKNLFGHSIGKGFLPDSHCPTGAPRESFVKITRAEAGGLGGQGLWRPVTLGLRAGNESEQYGRYLQGALIVRR